MHRLSACLEHTALPMLYDSGAFETQIPESDRHFLRNVKPLPAPIFLDTAGTGPPPKCTHEGILDLLLPPYPEPIPFRCILRPSASMWMMSVDAMEAFKPPCGSQTKSKLWANKITVGDYKIPIYRMQGHGHGHSHGVFILATPSKEK